VAAPGVFFDSGLISCALIFPFSQFQGGSDSFLEEDGGLSCDGLVYGHVLHNVLVFLLLFVFWGFLFLFCSMSLIERGCVVPVFFSGYSFFFLHRLCCGYLIPLLSLRILWGMCYEPSR